MKLKRGMKLLPNIRKPLIKHIKNNFKLYFMLVLAFAAGVSAGAFTVNGLSSGQAEELKKYINGFMNLLNNQRVDSSELLKISLMENAKIVLALWILGVTIIGIPFIFIIVGIRGFITGFSSGFIVSALGFKGVLFSLLTLMPKEIIVIPCILALGVSGINFSLNIIKKRSVKHIIKESLKSNFAAYCLVTLLYSVIIFSGVLVEAYITPIFARIIISFIIN
jgi:stage II sporulation protein M